MSKDLLQRIIAGAAVVALLGCGGAGSDGAAAKPPNIILIMTDDQGWAQLGSHGDDVLRTPHLDRLAEQSVELERFYVSPVCAPTRASLMTGRYNYRTGVVDTYMGRAMMAPDEVTIAEILGGGGYRTGIFGKWHLGDNHPMRAMDQGFDEAIVHLGGGIGQPPDPKGSDYFDPILFHNGEQKQYSGYCTDVYFDEAMRFMDGAVQAGEPFFVYLPTNAPHSPYLVPDAYREPYAAQGLNDKDARIYGMITNIDDNVGRLMARLDERGLAADTIVIFMTDNGPTTRRYTAGLRAQKTSVYDNGIRVPFFMRWPAELEPRKIDTIAAHIDVAPTLAAAARVAVPAGVRMDGRNLLPLLRGEASDWPERRFFIQIHRGDTPQLGRAFAVVGQQYKLVQPLSFGEPPPDAQMELYDLIADSGEQNDLAGLLDQRERVGELRAAYEGWFADVGSGRGYGPQRIDLGSEHENPVMLTRQDWRVFGEDGWGRGSGSLGRWFVDVQSAGVYEVRLELDGPAAAGARVSLELGPVRAEQALEAGAEEATFEGLEFVPGPGELDARVTTGGSVQGVWKAYVRLETAR